MRNIKYLIAVLLLGVLLGKGVEAVSVKSPEHFEPIEDVRTARNNSILALMFGRQKYQGKYLRGRPTDENGYYGWQVPGHLLDNAFYEGKQVSFHWYDYTLGKGEQFELIEIFVNESETEVIIFAIKDGKKYVFHSTKPSYPADGGFNLELTQDHSLRQFMEE
ncbi:hypothetical protein NHG29_00180 [Aerococcaceae bacterium NML160702]|nr:hypothetical protein [Aerococcaceae bacterium NML160702]